MNFQELLAKMHELDQPVAQAPVSEEPNEGNEFSGALAAAKAAGKDEFEVDGKKYRVKEDGSVEECGEMPGPMGASSSDSPPPSMSINLNAQGLDNIEELMKLIKAVNPGMDKPDMNMPTMSLPPLKMLPDVDGEPDVEIPKADGMNQPHMEPDGDEGPDITGLDRDGDGDHDMDDHNAEKKGKEDEAFMNSPENGSDTDTQGVNDILMRGNDIHKPKKSFSGKPYRGDNPMAAGAYESTDLRSQIRAELQRRLAEAKGAK